jgi:HPt (histidine-containing phosphotransfer) domain-containing protein
MIASSQAERFGNEVFDLRAALQQLDGDRKLLAELGELFFDECPGLLLRARAAVRAQDARALEVAAHTLKGAVSNFHAQASFNAASQLEKMGRTKDLSAAAVACALLEAELRLFERAWQASCGSLFHSGSQQTVPSWTGAAAPLARAACAA